MFVITCHRFQPGKPQSGNMVFGADGSSNKYLPPRDGEVDTITEPSTACDLRAAQSGVRSYGTAIFIGHRQHSVIDDQP